MEHYFNLPVNYNGAERVLKGRLATFGYMYKFYIVVDGRELVFEKDDQQQYRVLAEESSGNKFVDPGILKAIIDALIKL